MNICSHNMYVSLNVVMLNICDKLRYEMLIHVNKCYKILLLKQSNPFQNAVEWAGHTAENRLIFKYLINVVTEGTLMWELTGNFPRPAATVELLWNIPVWIPVFSPHMKYKPIKKIFIPYCTCKVLKSCQPESTRFKI